MWQLNFLPIRFLIAWCQGVMVIPNRFETAKNSHSNGFSGSECLALNWNDYISAQTQYQVSLLIQPILLINRFGKLHCGIGEMYEHPALFL
jgi:hypothetical protein